MDIKMNFTELKKEVTALGFENRRYDDAALASFARRAQKTVFSDRAVTKTIKVYIPKIVPSFKLEGLVHKGGEAETLEISGAAYSIELCGVGCVKISDGTMVRTESFDSGSITLKGFISAGHAQLTLEGEHTFFLLRLVTFATTYCDDPELIPNADGRISCSCARDNGDFLCFTGLPTDAFGNVRECIFMEDGVVTFPEGTEGELYLTYRRAPMPINHDTPLEPIDIPKQCEHLLTLLTASYMSLDCDGEQAQLYREVYEKDMRELNRSTSGRISNAYRDVTGWA